MPLQDVESPPYPGEGCTADSMYSQIKLLATWVNVYREDTNTELGRLCVPELKPIPDKKAYLHQPIPTQYRHWLLLRHIRAEWDRLIRTFESDWMCKPCMTGRIYILQVAVTLINNAFTPYEKIEAGQEREIASLQGIFNELVKILTAAEKER